MQFDERSERGFTLIEIVVVMTILVIAAGIVLTKTSRTVDDAKLKATKASLIQLRDAIIGLNGFEQDMQKAPATLADLMRQPPGSDLYVPVTQRGWNGPYLQPTSCDFEWVTPPPGISDTEFWIHKYGIIPEYGPDKAPCVIDSWLHIEDGTIAQQSRPIILQPPPTTPNREPFLRLVSAGPDGIFQTTPNAVGFSPTDTSVVGDDIVLFLTYVHPSAP